MGHLGFVAVVALVGCAKVDIPATLEAHRALKPCCAELRQVEFAPIGERQERVAFSVDGSAPAFAFVGSGLSRFKAFQVPLRSAPYVVTLRSDLFGTSPAVGGFFHPKMTALDSEHRPVMETRQEDIIFVHTGTDDMGPHRLQVSLAIRPEQNVRYLLVHTFADRIGRTQAYAFRGGSLTIPAAGSFVTIQGGGGLQPILALPVTTPDALELRFASVAQR